MGWGFYTATGALKDAEYTGSEFPVGTVIEYGGSTAPANWILCDGSALNRTTYSDLFAVIGTTYGAPGSTTFNVPTATGKIIYAIPRISRSAETTVYEFPIGTVVGTAGTTAPTGWLLCDGSAVSRTAYADLFGAVGTYYGTGDGSTTFNVPNITGSIIYAQSLSSRIAGTTPPQYVTSLPANPIDGQEIYYAADATNGIIWHLRYRSGSSSSYKWENLAPTPLVNNVTTQEARAVNSYADLSTVGPTITLPLSGDYYVQVGAGIQTPANTGSIANGLMSFAIGSSGAGTPSDDDAAYQVNFNSGAGEAQEGSCVGPKVLKTNLTSGHTVRAKYRSVAGTAYFTRRWIAVTPVRVG